MRYPVNQPFTITTGFGVPDSNALFGRHSGIDMAGFPAGRPVYAPTSGQLKNIVSNTGGNMVTIFDGQYYHRVMHNSSFSRSDGHVNEGDEVAKAGTTGLSTGVHCHWDVNTQGILPTSFNAFVNPLSIIGDDMFEGKSAQEWHDLYVACGQPNDGDVISWKRFQLGDPTFQPDGDTFQFYKQMTADRGWKRLAEDTRVYMQAHPPATSVNHDTALKYVQDNLG